MNKKIKIIEMFQKYANYEELPKKIAYKKQVFNLYDDSLYATDEECLDRFMDYINYDFSNLNDYIEILEDNTEEIEELDRNLKFDDLIAPYGKNEDMMWTEIIKQHNKIGEIIRYIKRKDKNND